MKNFLLVLALIATIFATVVILGHEIKINASAPAPAPTATPTPENVSQGTSFDVQLSYSTAFVKTAKNCYKKIETWKAEENLETTEIGTDSMGNQWYRDGNGVVRVGTPPPAINYSGSGPTIEEALHQFLVNRAKHRGYPVAVDTFTIAGPSNQ